MTSSNTHKESFWRKNPKVFLCLLLLVATFSVYWQVGNHDFINYDDPQYLTDNAQVQKGLTGEGFIWALTTNHAGNWHPLAWMSHMLDCELYGLNPRGHHLSNLLLHAANALLLFLIFDLMTGALWRSFFIAALFALHPLHVESVAWVAERKDVLCTLFWMLTLWAYNRYVTQPTINRYLLTLWLFALGLMAKPMLVTLPFVLLLLDYWPLGRMQFAQSGKTSGSQVIPSHRPPAPISSKLRLVLEKTPFFVLTAISSLVTFLVQQQSGAAKSLEQYPLADRLANALVSYATYIAKMIWPRNLAVFYPHPGSSLTGWQVTAASLLLFGVSILVVRAARRYPYFLVGWFWYLGTLVPVIGLVQVGGQALADRYTYVPLIGLFVMIAWGVPEWLARFRHARILLPLSMVGVLLSLMITSWLQLAHWRNSVALYEHALMVTENNYLAHNNLGTVLEEDGNLKEAILHYSKAVRIKPNYGDAHHNLGIALTRQGKFTEALNHYWQALRLDPDNAEIHLSLANALAERGKLQDAANHYSMALRLNPDHAIAHNNLGLIYTEQGKLKEAIFHFSQALRIKPSHADAHYNMAIALTKQGRLQEATRHYSEALRLNPDDAEAHNNLGNVFVRQGKLQDAINHYSEAVRIDPDFSEAYFNLGTVLARQGRSDEAISCFASALQGKPNFAEAHNSLGVLLAGKGRTDKAIYHFRQALQLEPNHLEVQSNLERALQAKGRQNGIEKIR